MTESNTRPSLAGPVMISISILILAGAIVHAGRPRISRLGDGSDKSNFIQFDDGSGYRIQGDDFTWERIIGPAR